MSCSPMLADRLDGWPARPGLLQVWVSDVSEVLNRANARGATTVTRSLPFYGEITLGRMLDPWDNLWWLWSLAPGQSDPDAGSDAIFTTLDAALRSLARVGAPRPPAASATTVRPTRSDA